MHKRAIMKSYLINTIKYKKDRYMPKERRAWKEKQTIENNVEAREVITCFLRRQKHTKS